MPKKKATNSPDLTAGDPYTVTERKRRYYQQKSVTHNIWPLHTAIDAVCLDIDDKFKSKAHVLFDQAVTAIVGEELKGWRIDETAIPVEKDLGNCFWGDDSPEQDAFWDRVWLRDKYEDNVKRARKNRLYNVSIDSFAQWVKRRGFDVSIFQKGLDFRQSMDEKVSEAEHQPQRFQQTITRKDLIKMLMDKFPPKTHKKYMTEPNAEGQINHAATAPKARHKLFPHPDDKDLFDKGEALAWLDTRKPPQNRNHD